MMDFVYLNDYIREFVDRKIAEKVRLDTRNGYMAVRPQSRRGSTVIAMFWVKVLQHELNFPSKKFAYHKYKDPVLETDKLILRAEDVIVVLNLSSGALEVQGPSAHTWFKRRFLQLLQNYDGLSAATRDWYFEEDAAKIAAAEVEKARRDTGLVHFHTASEELVSDLEKEHLRGLWTDEILDAHVEHVRSVCVREASSFIYRLWKSLLLRWLSDAETHVVLVTSRMDAPRLRDLTDLSLLRKDTACWDAILLPNTADPPRRTKADLQRDALVGYAPNEALWTEYQVFRHIITPPSRILCNFVAGLRVGEAQVLLTSCDFHADAFDRRETMASVQFLNMSEIMFNHEFLQPVTGHGAEPTEATKAK